MTEIAKLVPVTVVDAPSRSVADMVEQPRHALCDNHDDRGAPYLCARCAQLARAEKIKTQKMDQVSTPDQVARNQTVGLIGEAIMDGCEQHPPFPSMPSHVAWAVAEEIAKRLEKLGVKLVP